MQTVLTDEEFGEIALRRHIKSTRISVRLAPNGRLRASLPLHVSARSVQRLINSSREQLRIMLHDSQSNTVYEDGTAVGKSHRIVVRRRTEGTQTVSVNLHGQQIIVSIGEGADIKYSDTQRIIRDTVIRALRIEARAYIPRRLKFLAAAHNFSYERIRFSHASSRWGSCSSNGTISINIAIMQLPDELVSYVLLHELSHTIHMNHSESFWQLVGSLDPDYKLHRAMLATHSVIV